MDVVYDDAYLAAEEEHHQAQQAKWEAQRLKDIERCGSVANYNLWWQRELHRERDARAAAVARDRVYRAQTVRLRFCRPAITPRRTLACSRPRPRVRRTSSSSRTASADPGEPPAAHLRLAPPPRAVLTFGCLSAAERGGVAR